MINPYRSLSQLVDSLEADFSKFYEHHSQSAGSRVRRGLAEVKKQAVQIRHDVQLAKGKHSHSKSSPLDKPVASGPTRIPEERVEPIPLAEDCFTAVVGAVTYNRRTVHTHFTDAQAVAVCSKMADSYARQLAKEYMACAHQVQGGVLRYQLHVLAGKALQLYGGAVLSFLLKLRPLRFCDTTARAVRYRPTQDATTIRVDFPALTFRTLKGDEFTLAFHLVHEVGFRAKNPVQIFRNQQHVGSINTQGFAFDSQHDPIQRMARANPGLLIFCDFLQKSRSPAFYCGVESGTCYLCGRPLTDPASIRYGIGPVCLGRLTS